VVRGIGPAEVRSMAEENAAVAEDEDESVEICSIDGSVDLLEQALAAVDMLTSRPF